MFMGRCPSGDIKRMTVAWMLSPGWRCSKVKSKSFRICERRQIPQSKKNCQHRTRSVRSKTALSTTASTAAKGVYAKTKRALSMMSLSSEIVIELPPQQHVWDIVFKTTMPLACMSSRTLTTTFTHVSTIRFCVFAAMLPESRTTRRIASAFWTVIAAMTGIKSLRCGWSLPKVCIKILNSSNPASSDRNEREGPKEPWRKTGR
mmetsp:Transcript_47229/g.85064  ORF Transcript_47229/g.85064 Transcript_47229/m.85064 type:complete len:204 (+) Transcript_47229:122-733(+)